jgi:cysteinyl-tRNA synthetase
MTAQLQLYNTLTRRKEPFTTLEPGFARIYSCGPTVYSRQHLGNLRAYVFADLLNRTLRYFGYRVKHVINITDVGHLTSDADSGDDKMEKAAREQKKTAWEVAAHWTSVFRADLAKLNFREPDVWCKATDFIPEQVAMIETLAAKGFTYATSDGLYFDTSKDPHYGELARTALAEQETQERIEHASEKRNAADFALWKLSPPGEDRQMEWDSPWGRGFPGWHIECSAMSVKHLGTRFDIHTGGVDHIPVHHPNEIAQSEAALGVHPWVPFWLHGGWLMFGDSKLSKSTGGSVLNLDALLEAGIAPLSYRYFLLGGHYRQQLAFSEDAIRGAQSARDRLVRRAAELRDDGSSKGKSEQPALRERFREALADDLNAPRALAVAWEVARSEELGGREKWELLVEFDQVLALGLSDAKPETQEVDADIDALVRARDEARASRNFKRADELRDELKARGIVLTDSPQGTRWRRG